jgi:hypothetical protein
VFHLIITTTISNISSVWWLQLAKASCERTTR